ncbi:hypothetical protein Gotri_028095, partial [Gossypium trilobum]|nr:hypothetical protein [Gossypium trilobum]
NKAALTGGSGKVINSGPNDRIFIYYSDHGGPGTLGMPDKSHLYADQLIQGSMLEGLLPQGLNFYATTAANKEEGIAGQPIVLEAKKRTTKSHVMQYGDVQQLSNDYLSLYFGANAKFKFLDDDEDDHYLEPPTLQVTTFEIHYEKLAQYGMKHMLISFANICDAGIRTEQMVEASAEACAGIHSDH